MIDFEEHFNHGDILVLAFASGDGIRFEWGDYLNKLQLSHILFRDSLSQQYTTGTMGIGDVAETVQYIKDMKQGYRTIAIGLSNGGYGALYLGKLAAVDKVICMSPVTGLYIKDEFDSKWHHRLEPRPGPNSPNIVDLKPLYLTGPVPIVKAFIGDGYGTELDRQMVERIGVSHMTVLSGAAHADVGRIVRDNGMLEEELLG